MTQHKDTLEALSYRFNPPSKAKQLTNIIERPLPRFLKVEDYKPGESFAVSIPTARRTWWCVGFGVILFLWAIIIPIAFGSAFGSYIWTRSIIAAAIPLLTWGALLLFLTYVVYRLSCTRIIIRANQTSIKVHNRSYPWDRADGFRIGYSIGGVERSQKQWIFSGIRMSYGPYGDDLPFMVQHFYAPIYVIFLNQMLEAIEPKSQSDKAADTGIKVVLF